jgi:protein phosphatase-4 regulatory subunit 3
VLLNKIVGLIMKDSDPELGMANNISTMIRNLLDSDNVVTLTSMGRTSPRSLIEKQSTSKNDKLDFFSMFYSRIIETLVTPLFDNVLEGKLKQGNSRKTILSSNSISDNYFKASQMALILELTSFCVENHVQFMRNFIIQKDLLSVIGVYLRSQHHFMALSALRVLRKVLQQKDEQYNRYTVEKKVIDAIVACFVENGERYNLLNSAILEFFEFMRHVSFQVKLFKCFNLPTFRTTCFRSWLIRFRIIMRLCSKT